MCYTSYMYSIWAIHVHVLYMYMCYTCTCTSWVHVLFYTVVDIKGIPLGVSPIHLYNIMITVYSIILYSVACIYSYTCAVCIHVHVTRNECTKLYC